MENRIPIDEFTIEKQCEYKERFYSVRDNGAIFRHPKKGGRLSRYDNKWTFGIKDLKTGYMKLAGVSVHQIVAMAFHGETFDSKMVVDHIDTNRCNNRPENLRWVTRFENILNNPITRKRIESVCGSVEEFLDNPAKFKDQFREPNISWMCTVTKEEAAKCKRNLERWASEDKVTIPFQNKGIDNWIFRNENIRTDNLEKEKFNRLSIFQQQEENVEKEKERIYEREDNLIEALTPNALQENWKIPSEFPLCPKHPSNDPLTDYLSNLKVNKTFCKNEVYESTVCMSELSEDKSILAVITTGDSVKGGDGYCLATITFENGKYIHHNKHSFFEKIGAMKYMILALGKEWTGGDVFDDYC